MKIAIYGDSFACPKSARYPELNSDISWMQLLKLQGYDIINFGLSATSVYWSYMNYKNNHMKFDKNIFIATSTGRIYIPWNDAHPHWTGYSVTDAVQLFRNKHKSGFEEVFSYFTKIYNDDEHQLYKKLMIKDISLDQNSLVVDNTDVLQKISRREVDYYNSLNLNVDKRHDNRYCHMSQEGNNFFASRVAVWLETGTFDINDWEKNCQLPNTKNINGYFPNII